MDININRDVEIVRQIKAIPTILEVVCKTTGMGFAAVARVTRDHWVACEVLDSIDFGLKPGGELKVETTICSEIREARDIVAIDDVANDSAYCAHPTPAMYGFRSYISVPIILSDGSFFGTLCAIDPRPARLKSPEIIGMFRLFAELIATHIDARTRLLSTQEKLAASESELIDAQSASKLREEFIAVLGHDLRNPLAAVVSGVRLLQKAPQDDKSKTILQMMTASALRMSALVDNVLDFARGRLGGGLSLEKELKSLKPTLTQVLDEIRSAWPDRRIETSFDLDRPFNGDHSRLGQLFSNLLGNAVTHGAENQPITIEASNSADGLRLSVANAGHPIPEAMRERLFQPFYRGQVRPNLQGLGLGLFIASEIARAHGGRLIVKSDETGTQFLLTAPPG